MSKPTTVAPAARPTARRDEILMERETVLRWDGHKDQVHLFTAAPTVYRKLCRAGYAPDRVSAVKGRECGWFFRIPYRDLRWGARPRQTHATPPGFRGRMGASQRVASPLALA
jgi:hypothetical protein